MTENRFQVISQDKFATQKWVRMQSLGFARQDMAVSLTLADAISCMNYMATAFMADASGYAFVGIQGFETNSNLFIEDDGRWTGRYIPQLYQFYPFKLARNASNEFVMCIDTASGVLRSLESQDEGYYFYKDGAVSPAIADFFNKMLKYEADMVSTRKITEKLASLDLLEPWPMRLEKATGVGKIEGFYRICESKLNTLAPDDLAELRNMGGLMLAYSQLFAMQNLKDLAQRHILKFRNATAQTEPAVVDYFSDNGTINFSGL